MPIAPDAAWVEELRAGLPEAPGVRRRQLQEAWGLSDFEMQSMANAGAIDLVEQTVAAGAPQRRGPQVVAGRDRPARERAGRRRRRSCRSRRRRSPASSRSSTRARSTTSWRARSSRACSPARASPTRSWPPRARGRVRRQRAARGRRRGARGPARRRREDPRRQGRRGRRDRRRGDEGDARPGRRRPGPRAGPRTLHLAPVLAPRPLCGLRHTGSTACLAPQSPRAGSACWPTCRRCSP